MTVERVDEPTPAGGDYSVATYVMLDPMVEVDKSKADGIVITEYTATGEFVAETVATYSAPAVEEESDDAFFAKLGIEEDDSDESTITFVGPEGLAAARKLTQQQPE